jgi:hypothetical protein
MASEREVFNRVVDKSPAPAAAKLQSAATTDIELFDSVPLTGSTIAMNSGALSHIFPANP